MVGFESTGRLRAEDHRDVVFPAPTRAAETGEVRFVIVMTEFHAMSGGALWRDLRLWIEHLRAWKRIAVVTDIEWGTHLTALLGWMTPGETKVFPPRGPRTRRRSSEVFVGDACGRRRTRSADRATRSCGRWRPAGADRCARHAGGRRPPGSRNFVKTADPWVENTIR